MQIKGVRGRFFRPIVALPGLYQRVILLRTYLKLKIGDRCGIVFLLIIFLTDAEYGDLHNLCFCQAVCPGFFCRRRRGALFVGPDIAIIKRLEKERFVCKLCV